MSTRGIVYALAIAFVAVMFVAVALPAAEQSQEIAARAMLGEAESMLELSDAQDALAVLDKLKSDYPGTEAAAYAEFRRAEALTHFDADAALACAQQAVDQNPGTLLACWAQCVVGEALISKRQLAQGVAALLRVADMLPDDSDLGPLERANSAIGCYVSDDVDGLRVLGASASDRKTGARLLLMLASGAAKAGAIDKSEALLARLESVYPDQIDSVRLAASMVEAGKVRKSMMEEPLAAVANNSQLATRLAMMDDYSAADGAILLAKNCRRRGDVVQAESILDEVRQRPLASQKAAPVLYELGEVLHLRGRSNEAVPLYEKIADEIPTSGYAAPALYSAGTYSTGDPPTAIRLLTRLAEGGYDTRWRGLAYRQLGGLYKSTDKAKAQECYQQAISKFTQCLAEEKVGVRQDWRDLLQADIDQMQFEIGMLNAQGQEVTQ